jgi:hypothetical protein
MDMEQLSYGSFGSFGLIALTTILFSLVLKQALGGNKELRTPESNFPQVHGTFPSSAASTT